MRTKPETPRAKKRKSVTQRLSGLEERMDALEVTVVQKLDSFERNVIQQLASLAVGNKWFRAGVGALGIAIIAVLFYIDGN